MASKTLDLEKKLLGQWNALIRRARIGRDYKAAALTMSSYADPDGTGIRLSVARFAVDLEVSYSTARRYLRWLQKVGLLEMTRVGSRRMGTASEYRLILGPDVLEELNVLTPTQQKALADEMREANRSGVRGRAARSKDSVQRSSKASAEIATEVRPEAPDLRSPEQAQMTEFSAQMDVDQRSPWMTHTPFRTHLSEEDRPSRADDEDLGTAVTGPRESREEPKPHPSLRPKKCPDHNLGGGLRPDGLPECPLCRVDLRRPPRPPEPDPPPPSRPPRCEHGLAADRCGTCLAEHIAPVIDLSTRRTA